MSSNRILSCAHVRTLYWLHVLSIVLLKKVPLFCYTKFIFSSRSLSIKSVKTEWLVKKQYQVKNYEAWPGI